MRLLFMLQKKKGIMEYNFCCRIHNHKTYDDAWRRFVWWLPCSYTHFWLFFSSVFAAYFGFVHDAQQKKTFIFFITFVRKNREIWKAKSTLNREIKMRRSKLTGSERGGEGWAVSWKFHDQSRK